MAASAKSVLDLTTNPQYELSRAPAPAPKVVAPVDVPFYEVAVALGRKGLVAGGFGDCAVLGVAGFFRELRRDGGLG